MSGRLGCVAVAVLMVVFLSAPAVNAAGVELLAEDWDTGGQWIGTYGSEGYWIPYPVPPEEVIPFESSYRASDEYEMAQEMDPEELWDVVSLPDYIDSITVMFLAPGGLWTWILEGFPIFEIEGEHEAALKAMLQSPPGYEELFEEHVPCAFAGNGPLLIEVVPKTDDPYRVAMYLVDYDSTVRVVDVEVYCGETEELLFERPDIDHFTTGVWLSFEATGSIEFWVHHIGGANAVMTALMFD